MLETISLVAGTLSILFSVISIINTYIKRNLKSIKLKNYSEGKTKIEFIDKYGENYTTNVNLKSNEDLISLLKQLGSENKSFHITTPRTINAGNLEKRINTIIGDEEIISLSIQLNSKANSYLLKSVDTSDNLNKIIKEIKINEAILPKGKITIVDRKGKNVKDMFEQQGGLA